MLEAALFAAVGQAALLVGAVLVWRFRALTQPFRIGLIMAFGAGAVISAVAIDLVAVAYDEAGAGPAAFGIAAGGLGYFVLISFLERTGASERPGEPVGVAATEGQTTVHGASPTEARNLFIGMIIDGVPESVSIGLTLHSGAVGVSAALVGAVFLAGLPEAIGVAAALLAGGFGMGRILLRFGIVVGVGAVSGAIGYQSLVGAYPAAVAVIQSVAAGALLVVVVNEMIPIAVRGAQRWAGVMATAGFVFSALMTWIGSG